MSGILLKQYWWCPKCDEEVPSSHVTYEEMHDIDSCGSSVVWRDNTDEIIKATLLDFVNEFESREGENLTENTDGFDRKPPLSNGEQFLLMNARYILNQTNVRGIECSKVKCEDYENGKCRVPWINTNNGMLVHCENERAYPYYPYPKDKNPRKIYRKVSSTQMVSYSYTPAYGGKEYVLASTVKV